MTKILIEEAVVRQALEALENHPGNYKLSKAECAEYRAVEDALRQAIEQAALHKLAADSITEGLSLDDWNKIGCVNHDCDKCKAQQPAPAQEPVAFLAKGTRFKMAFFENDDGPGTHVTCFGAFEKELDGRWVALVAAEDDCHLKLTHPAPAQSAERGEPVALRLPKIGDEVVCIEDDSLGTVVHLTAGGSPEINFDDGSHGTYLLREFAELFRYTTPPAPASKPWIGLTDEEVAQIADSEWEEAFVKLIEAKLKEKNT